MFDTFHIHITPGAREILAALDHLKDTTVTKDELQAAVDAANDQLQTVSDQLSKASTEIQTEVQALKDEIANGNVGTTPAMDASIARLQSLSSGLKTASQGLDDMNADAPVDTPPADDGTQTP